MNAGAAAAVDAGCDLIWFLHADAVPPSDAHDLILAAVQTGAAGGAFRRRFESPSVFLRFTCWLADWRCRCWGWFLGDQGIFVTREVFAAVGGFPEWPRFEDLEFSRRTRRLALTVLVRATLLTSGRRFAAAGAWRQSMRDVWATCRYLWRGAPPARAHDQAKAGERSGRPAADRSVGP
jgi:GT2 family glycosyltransferase